MVKRWGNKYEDKRDWKEYNARLVKRGEFYINPSFLETWRDEVKKLNEGKVGQPYLYPASMVEFLGILRAKGFDFRALEGIMRALSKRLGPFPVISFSQIRRRVKQLRLSFRAKGKCLVTGTDGTGMKVSNRGEWIRQKWKIRRGWVRVVVLGDVKGNIIDIRVGNENLDENAASRGMLRKNAKNIDRNLADGFHDSKYNFNLYEKLGIDPGIKIRRNASNKGFGPRPRAVKTYQKLKYKAWAKEKQYGRRWVATEGIFSAVKRIFGETLNSHKTRNLYHEATLKFWAYQQIRDIS